MWQESEHNQRVKLEYILDVCNSVHFVNKYNAEKYSLNFFLWQRQDADELKLIFDDKNYAASSLQDETRVLFEDYWTFKIHPIG